MKRIWILAPLVLILAWVSCTVVKHRQVVNPDQKLARALEASPGQEVVGYTTADAVYHPFGGRVRLANPDSLHFYAVPTGMFKDATPTFAFAMARQDVSTLAIRQSKTLATIGLLVVSVTAVVVAILALSHDDEPSEPPPATTTSCPLVYSWDGAQFVLDAEPYGGATIRALERTDVTELEHLVPSHGEYRLLLTNEMEETQHTNRIDLLVADHAPGLTVAPDLEGVPHAFATVQRLVDARDEKGRDVLPWLVEKDQVLWHPDLEAASKRLPADDVRDHLTLTFDRPAGARSAYLLADAATAPWGARMILPMLEMRGATLGLFYAAINADESARRKLLDWNEREELFELGVEVNEDGRWARQGHLLGGGPIAAETRAIAIDLGRVTGDRVQVRIHPPIGFWMFNSFRLASAEVPLRTQVISALDARDAAGKQVRSSIQADDDSYLTFASNEARAVVRFTSPAPSAGTVRTVFARTRGWYEIRTGGAWMPDVAEIDRVTNEPGYSVRFALREFRERTDAHRAQGQVHEPIANALER